MGIADSGKKWPKPNGAWRQRNCLKAGRLGKEQRNSVCRSKTLFRKPRPSVLHGADSWRLCRPNLKPVPLRFTAASPSLSGHVMVEHRQLLSVQREAPSCSLALSQCLPVPVHFCFGSVAKLLDLGTSHSLFLIPAAPCS